MEKLKISKEKLIKIKDIVIFILLFIWMIMPILQSIKVINEVIVAKNLYFILMRTIAVLGIGTTIFTIYDKFQKSNNKKEIFKELLPIFLFVIYMIWTLISCHQAARKNRAFNGTPYRKEGYFMYINYAGFFFCAMLLENKKLRNILLNAFIITSIFLISINRFIGKSITNVFANTNHYGYYLTMSLICSLGLFLTEKNKILKVIYLAVYTVIGYGLIDNNTFGCYLAVIAILVLYAIYAIIKKTDRKLIFIAITIFILLSGVTLKNGKNIAYQNIKQLGQDIQIIISKIMNIETQSIDGEEVQVDEKFEKTGSSRMALWTNGIKFILEKPIIGYGPENLRDKYLFWGINIDRPHNLLIYLGCVSGIPGMLIYVAAVGIIVIRGIKKLLANNQSTKIFLLIVITYLISSMFGNSMYYTSPYFFIFLGSLMHFNLNKQEE